MAERLGQKTLTKAMQEEILKVDGRNANLDSKPEVLGTAWSMHQQPSMMVPADPEGDRKFRQISKNVDIRGKGVIERDIKRLQKAP
jgi:hypothetical protein